VCRGQWGECEGLEEKGDYCSPRKDSEGIQKGGALTRDEEKSIPSQRCDSQTDTDMGLRNKKQVSFHGQREKKVRSKENENNVTVGRP
jgi:hypothetical protein